MEFSHLQYPVDPQDNIDELRERSENINAARDAAYEAGYEAYRDDAPAGTREEMAARWEKARLITDFCDGWDTAAMEPQ